MNKTLNFKTFKTFLQLILLVVSVFGFSQAPALEMASPAASNGVVYTYSTNLQKNTDNPSGNTFTAYSTPSNLSATFTINNQTYTANNTYNNQPGSVFFGDVASGTGTNQPPYVLLNSLGNVSAGAPWTADNNQYTSYGSTAGTGIDVASNYGVRTLISTNALGAQSTTGRYKMGEVTITFSRGINNPLLHLKGLGGALGTTFSFTAEFTVKSVLNSSNTEILSTTNLSLLSGSNITVDNTAKTINNSYTGLTSPATTNSGRGTVNFQANDIKTIVLELYMNGNTAGQSWTANKGGLADAFLMSVSAGESDLQVTKTVDNSTPNEGSNVVFTVAASNLGASNNTNVTVNDLLPSGYTYVSHSASTGTYVPGTGVWTIGNLNDQANATLTITAIVNATGNFTNTATISTTSGIADPNTTNNTASVSTTPVITDSDGDGVPDSLDLDDDNDGILDTTEGQCINTSNPSTDGFDSPLVATVNGNNIQSVNPYNGWGTETGVANAFNVIRVNGAGYSSGPDVAQSGTQYIDINNSSTYVYKNITLTTPTIVSASAWFANRETSSGNYSPWSTKIEIRNETTGTTVAQGNTINFTSSISDKIWYNSSINSVALPAGTYRIRMFVHNSGHLDSISYCFSTDTDGDGTPDYLDVDSDNDGCADAIEGSENVKYNQIHDLNLPLADPNYAYRGQIKVTYNGTTTSTPSGIISNSPSTNGVPQLLNNAGNNLNASTNPSDLAGAVDNTDGTADIGQGIGDSQDNTINSCKCYKAPSTDGNNYPTNHGITAFNRAGADNQNWPMVRQSGWTALEASTKGFVINRMPVSTSGGNIGEPVDGSNNAVITSPIAGMMFYDTTNDCLKINVDGTRSGWKCFNKQTCPDEN